MNIGIKYFISFVIFLLNKKSMKLNFMLSVESAGVEPASKQVTKVLSTCVSFYWLSGSIREKAPKIKPYLLNFIPIPKTYRNYPDVVGASNQKGIGQSLL